MSYVEVEPGWLDQSEQAPPHSPVGQVLHRQEGDSSHSMEELVGDTDRQVPLVADEKADHPAAGKAVPVVVA